MTNKIDCFGVDGGEGMQIEAQSMLPDISDFELLGEELKGGQNCQKWQKVQKVDELSLEGIPTNICFSQIGEKVNKYTIWVRMSGDTVVPVHYEMKGFNSLMGSHYDHYFLSYQNFSPEKPADEGVT